MSSNVVGLAVFNFCMVITIYQALPVHTRFDDLNEIIIIMNSSYNIAQISISKNSMRMSLAFTNLHS